MAAMPELTFEVPTINIGSGKPMMTIHPDRSVTMDPDLDIEQVKTLPLECLLLIRAVVERAIEEVQDETP